VCKSNQECERERERALPAVEILQRDGALAGS